MILSFPSGASAPFFVRLSSIFCLLILGLTACQNQKEASQTASPEFDLSGQKWELMRMNSETVKPSLYSNGLPYIEFGSEGNLNGFTGCNSFNGMYNAKDSLVIKPGAMTKMYCPNIPESEFIQLLSQARNIDISEGELRLMEGTNELLKFKAAKE